MQIRSHSLSLLPTMCVISLLCAAAVIPANAQNPFFITLANLYNDIGFEAFALVQANDGNFYGAGSDGGIYYYGTVFKATPAGELSTLHAFNGGDGRNPSAALVQATDGNLYGTTWEGGANGGGTVFRITLGGTLTTLYSFCAQPSCADGLQPVSALVQATDGNLYGTSWGGGANDRGTIFRITPAGTLTTPYSFCAQPNCRDGADPRNGLMQASDGNLYGDTNGGGDYGGGTIFKITVAGVLTTIHSFNGIDGGYPEAPLIQASDGNLYGTTYFGGNNNGGTIFKVSTTGILTTLYSFCAQPNCRDGINPRGALVQARDGNFYGTTENGGLGQNCLPFCGTVFKVTSSGLLTTLHSFCTQQNCADGFQPVDRLVQATNGSLYGTTQGGGIYGSGTVFRVGAARSCATCNP